MENWSSKNISIYVDQFDAVPWSYFFFFQVKECRFISKSIASMFRHKDNGKINAIHHEFVKSGT